MGSQGAAVQVHVVALPQVKGGSQRLHVRLIPSALIRTFQSVELEVNKFLFFFLYLVCDNLLGICVTRDIQGKFKQTAHLGLRIPNSTFVNAVLTVLRA